MIKKEGIISLEKPHNNENTRDLIMQLVAKALEGDAFYDLEVMLGIRIGTDERYSHLNLKINTSIPFDEFERIRTANP